MRNWLLNRLVLAPSQDTIDASHKQVHTLSLGRFGSCQLWSESFTSHTVTSQPTHATRELLVVKFPGTSGRAEKAGPQPLEAWQPINAEVWAVNPPGYGSAKGPPRLAATQPMVDAIVDQIEHRRQGRPLLVMGNSLGNLAALRCAAQTSVSALILRNPPLLGRVIEHRSRKFGAALIGRWLANGLPQAIEPIGLARQCQPPALFIHCEQDQIAPLPWQQEIAQAYAGPQQALLVRGADHADPIPESQEDEYAQHLSWLAEHLWSQ